MTQNNAAKNIGLTLDQVKITLGETELINLSAQILAGETLTIMGPSGSGKSTLLAYIAGFLDPIFKAQGGVIINGRDILALPAYSRKIGLMFQDALLFPHLSVGGNVLMAIPQNISGKKERIKMAQAALDDVDLSAFFDRDPDTLSGGQKARVALARTLLSKPEALLLDEPFSKLDAALRTQIRALVFDTARKHALPVLLVTHDAADAEAAGGTVIHVGS